MCLRKRGSGKRTAGRLTCLLAVCAIVAFTALAGCSRDDPDLTGPGLPGPRPPTLPPQLEVTPVAGGALDTPVVEPCSGLASPPVAARVNERQTISGRAVAVHEIEDELGRVTLLELGEPGGPLVFAIAIPIDELYIGKTVCVNGVVQDLGDVPVIFALTPADITILGG
jgi:hypothetical protein